MRIYNRYIISLVATSAVINTMLAALGQDDLGVYFTVNLIAYLVIGLLYVHFNPRAKGLLTSTWVVLFGGFMVIVAIKVMEILGI